VRAVLAGDEYADAVRADSKKRGCWAPAASRSSSSTGSTASPARSRPRRSCTRCGPRTPRGRAGRHRPLRSGPMRVKSLGFQTDLALRVLEGAEVTDRGDYLVVRSRANPPSTGATSCCWPLAGARHRGRLAGPVRRRVPAGRARCAGRGRDARARGDIAGVPGRGLEFERATVLTCAAVQPPPHQNTDAEIRRLESDDDWEQSRDLGIRCYGYQGSYLDRRARGRRRLTQAGERLVRSVHRRTPAGPARGVRRRGGLAATRTSKPTPRPAPGPAGTLVGRAGRHAARRSARARSSSWPTGRGRHPGLPLLRLRRRAGPVQLPAGRG